MRPALIATDLDGTFFGADALAHPRNIAAAHEVAAAGIEFVVATGRPRRNLAQLAPLLRLDPIVISSNGAAVGRLSADAPDIIHPIDAGLLETFVAALPRWLEPVFGVEYPTGWGHEPDYPAPQTGGAVVAPIRELAAGAPVLKLAVHTRRADTERLAAAVADVAGHDLVCTFSWLADHGTIEVSAPGVTKGTALAEVVAGLGLDPADCAAFGDMPNDLDMLRFVGHPFIVAGAHERLLGQGFTQIGDHADGAVGDQLRRFLA